MKIDYVTNLDIEARSGGWTGANASLYEAISAREEALYHGPINPPPDFLTKTISAVARRLRARGRFQFFSSERLDRIARQVNPLIRPSADCALFFGCTPWIHTTPSVPYFTYTDCSFKTYIDVYHDRRQFISADLSRIENSEKKWLQRAAGVFVATSWGADAMIEGYALDPSLVQVAGMGGAIDIPDADAYSGSRDLVFIAHDFESKGGAICIDVYMQLKNEIPQLRLIVIGGAPPQSLIAGEEGILWLGTLRKDQPAEALRYRETLRDAFLLIHPSMADLGSAAILEAAYFGCPSVAPNRLCYKDQVADGISGVLIDPPLRTEDFASVVRKLAEDEVTYARMRLDARRRALTGFTWGSVAELIIGEMAGRCELAGVSVTQPVQGKQII